jgi:hypothetical protein
MVKSQRYKNFFLALLLMLGATLSQAEEGVKAKIKLSAKANPSQLMEAQLFYTALDLQLKKVLAQNPYESEDLELLETLILKTGIEALEDYARTALSPLPLGSIHFMLGKEAYQSRNLKEAEKWLKIIPRWHRYYPESRFILADMAADAGSSEQRIKLEKECFISAANRAKEVQSSTLKRYFKVLQEDCQALRARKLFKAKKYKESLVVYDSVQKTAYKWPYLLLEKAWAYYKLENYNRSLGLLVTYKSPLLSDYFIPEAEVLTALGYVRMCLYEDALKVVDQYYNVYKPRAETLEKMLSQNKTSQTFFYNLLRLNTKEKTMTDPFIAQLAEQIAARPRFSLDRDQLTKVQTETLRLAKVLKALKPNHPAKKWVEESLSHLAKVKENLVGKVNYYTKKELFDFISEVYALSEELFKVKLEILARQKDLIYSQKSLASNRARGDVSNVTRTRFEHFWKFEGAFWADELGDYSFGLKSNCQTKQLTPKELLKEG